MDVSYVTTTYMVKSSYVTVTFSLLGKSMLNILVMLHIGYRDYCLEYNHTILPLSTSQDMVAQSKMHYAEINPDRRKPSSRSWMSLSKRLPLNQDTYKSTRDSTTRKNKILHLLMKQLMKVWHEHWKAYQSHCNHFGKEGIT